MNWDLVKKNVGRASTVVLQKSGFNEKTVDHEYEVEEEKFIELGEMISDLHGEAKGFLDAIRSLSMLQERMASSFYNLFEDSPELARQARLYKEVCSMISSSTKHEFDDIFRQTTIEPTTRYAALFPEAKILSSKRSRKLLDYDRVKGRVERGTVSPLNDPNQLPRLTGQADECRQIYERLNGLLKEGMADLIHQTPSYFAPSLTAMIKLQHKCITDINRQIQTIPSTNKNGGNSAPEKNAHSWITIQNKMDEIRDLRVFSL